MKAQITQSGSGVRAMRAGLSAILVAMLSACVNYAGIHSDKQMAKPQQFETTQSLPAESGHWPAADWADQFGDAQLKGLLEEALKGSPTLAQARARLAGAQAYADTAKASTMPRVDAEYSLTRQQFSGTAEVPPPYAGSWQTQNSGLLSASYDLDLWGKNREALKAAISQVQASEADAEVVKLTLTTAVARTYNQLARLYVLHDIAQQEVERREQIDRITAGRIATGLDTQVERKTAQANLATARSALAALDGSILTTRYQLAALMGEGPDRGLTIARPALGVGDAGALAGQPARQPREPPPGHRRGPLARRRDHARSEGSEGRVLPGHQSERRDRPRRVRLRPLPDGGEPHGQRGSGNQSADLRRG